jgi:hypothetical protein
MVDKLQMMTEKLASIILYDISSLYYVYEQALVSYIHMPISPAAHVGSDLTPDIG